VSQDIVPVPVPVPAPVPEAPDVAEATGPSRWWHGARMKLLIGLLIVIGALAWVTVRGLSGSFVYYLTPTDIVTHHKAHVGERVRLGGYVLPGSVGHTSSTLTFTISDETNSIAVSSVGSVPELFRAGEGVVLEGSLGADGTFHADTLLIKHNGDYRPPAPGEKPPTRADLGPGG
jgi:cytochrome c-type biogenesis protein CcmE